MKYLLRKKAPVCLHAINQPLVESIWKEGNELAELAKLLVREVRHKEDVWNNLSEESKAITTELLTRLED